MKKKISILLILASLVCFLGYVMSNNPERLIGSIHSNKYHYESCSAAKRIKYRNVRIFLTPEEAIKAGYLPCKICKPPTTTEKER